MNRREAGITLVEVVAILTVLGILLALLVPMGGKAARYDKIKECESHLKALYSAQAKAPASPVQEIGRAYWVRLTQTQPPLVTPDLLRCPFVDSPEAPFCQYFGPGGVIAQYADKDP